MNNERKISPKEFSDKRKSQDDEILRKQLELREREIALKEKELELRMLQAQGSENSVGQGKLELERARFRFEKTYSRIIVFFVIGCFLLVFVFGAIIALIGN